MKRLLWLLVCILLLAGPGAVLAEENEAWKWDDFFRTAEGRVSFTLPCGPTVAEIPDLEEEAARESGVEYLGWRGMLYLYCETGEGYVECGVADLTPMLSQLRQDHPGLDERNYQANALTNFAYFLMSLFDGDYVRVPEAQLAVNSAGEELVGIRFECQYEDDPETCVGRAMMDGSRAVVMLGTDDEDTAHYLEEMRAVTAEEAAALSQREPETLAVHEMRVTLPGTPDSVDDPDEMFFDLMGPGYDYITVRFLPEDFSDDGKPNDILLRMTLRQLMDHLRDKGELEEGYAIDKVRPGLWRCKGTVPLGNGWGTGFFRQQRVDYYLTYEGLYEVVYDDCASGWAVADSVEFPADGAE